MEDKYVVKWDDEALEGLEKIGDKRKQEKVKKRVEEELLKNPYKGELLSSEFRGLRSLHLLNNKFRVVYKIFQVKIKVILIVEAGWREGFYKRLARRFK